MQILPRLNFKGHNFFKVIKKVKNVRWFAISGSQFSFQLALMNCKTCQSAES